MIWREILLKNAENGSGKLGEGKWQIGRREVENWPKGSGKSGTCSLTEETNMKYDSARNPVEKC